MGLVAAVFKDRSNLAYGCGTERRPETFIGLLMHIDQIPHHLIFDVSGIAFDPAIKSQYPLLTEGESPLAKPSMAPTKLL